MSLADGSLQGMEALVRWQHPDAAWSARSSSLPSPNRAGSSRPFGRWVMHEACRQLKAWQDEGLALVPMAVNLSALEFRQSDMAADIAALLQTTGTGPRFLEIELTESVLMHQAAQVLDTSTPKALGVGISIDDFGTGYSSGLPQALPHRQAQDRPLVCHRNTRQHDDEAIITAIIQMGRSLQLKTVAEGVETPHSATCCAHLAAT